MQTKRNDRFDILDLIVSRSLTLKQTYFDRRQRRLLIRDIAHQSPHVFTRHEIETQSKK